MMQNGERKSNDVVIIASLALFTIIVQLCIFNPINFEVQ